MATKVLMPKLSDTMKEGVILKWIKKEGEKIKQGEILVEIESDKADMELEAYDSGIVKKIFVPEGKSAAIGAPLAIIADTDEDISDLLIDDKKQTPVKSNSEKIPEESTSTKNNSNDSKNELNKIKASPLAKKIAKDSNIDLSKIKGSGPNGRIIKKDVEEQLASKSNLKIAKQDLELSPIRKTIGKRMQESKQTIPHFYVTIEINMDEAINLRKQLNASANIKISFTDIIIKSCAHTLLKNPQVNSAFINNSISTYNQVNIAIAVAIDDGLVTPVIKNCEQKTIQQISAELKELAERARNRRLKPEEYSGSTFTISNLGMYDVENFAAIINPPESAILAVSSIIEKPIVKNGQIVIGKTMNTTLSCDHRVLDGVIAAKFLQDLKSLMENPLGMFL